MYVATSSRTHMAYMGLRLPKWIREAIAKDGQTWELPDSEIVRQILERHFTQEHQSQVRQGMANQLDRLPNEVGCFI